MAGKSRKVDGAACITDGCNPELVEGAFFDGILEIPIVKKPAKLMVLSGMVPFSKIDRVDDPGRFAVCECELDVNFADLLRNPEAHVDQIRRFQAFITPDASLYWGMPLAAQIVNKYRNHAVGYFMQSKGIYTIPNVRWGDERTYTTDFLTEPLAFLGVEKHSIVSIGSYGVVKTGEEKRHFRAGLKAMLEWLEPEIVLVYGSTPDDVFGEFWKCSEFVKYPDWTSYLRRDEEQAWLPEGWGPTEVRKAGSYVTGLKRNSAVPDGTPMYGTYKGVRVGVIRTNGKIATVFPDAVQP